MNTYRRDDTDGFVRYEFSWYDFGISRNYKKTEVWINSNRSAPINVRTFCRASWLKESPARFFRWEYSGSMVKPNTHWSFQIGRLGIGGETPKPLVWLHNHLRDLRNLRWDFEHDNFMLKQQGLPESKESFHRHLSEILFLRLHCYLFGHTLDVESDIGPDSGSEDFSCDVCDWSETVNWY